MLITGTTYSVSHYKEFEKTGNKDIFESIIDSMIMDGIAGMNESFRRAISSLPKDKKRLAILSILDKDRNLFAKIKESITDINLSKIDHVKNIILMLREYVKIAEVEKKKFGEVMTPLDLVKEMLNTLPAEVWSNPNLKWLDPANGTGPFPVVVIYKLMKGLESWEPDADKRYKHIIENMIYVCELQPKNMFLYLCTVDPKDELACNIYTGSFLDEGFDYHMKNVWGVENFDIVIGNPPYQAYDNKSNKLWIKFIEKSVKNSNMINFVVPTSLIKSDSTQMRKVRSLLKENKNLFNLKYQDIFNIGEKVVFFTTYKSLEKNTKVLFTDGSKIIDNSIIENRFPISENDEIRLKIIDKIENKKFKKIEFVYDFYHGSNQTTPNRLIEKGIVSKEKNDIYKYKVHHSASNILYAKEKHNTFGKLKVVFNISGNFIGDKYMFLSEDLIGKQMVGILVDSIKTGENIIDIYSKKIFNYYINNEKTGGFNTGIFKLPMMDVSREWTDEQLFEYFNLTEEEKQLILNS